MKFRSYYLDSVQLPGYGSLSLRLGLAQDMEILLDEQLEERRKAMGFTIRQATTAELDAGSELRSFVEGLYAAPLVAPSPEPGNGVQFEYDELSPEELAELIGEVTNASAPIGVHVDIDPVRKGDYYVFSVTRLADNLKSKHTSPRPKGRLARIFGGRSTSTGAKAEFINTVIGFAENPRGDYPIITIWW